MFQSFWEWENNPLKGGTFGLTAVTRDGVLLAFGAQDLKMVLGRDTSTVPHTRHFLAKNGSLAPMEKGG